MRAIRLTDEKKPEQGVRIMILNRMVRFMPEKGVYQVPGHILTLLDEQHIPYEFVEARARNSRSMSDPAEITMESTPLCEEIA